MPQLSLEVGFRRVLFPEGRWKGWRARRAMCGRQTNLPRHLVPASPGAGTFTLPSAAGQAAWVMAAEDSNSPILGLKWWQSLCGSLIPLLQQFLSRLFEKQKVAKVPGMTTASGVRWGQKGSLYFLCTILHTVCVSIWLKKEEGNHFLMVFFISSHFSVPLTHPYFLPQTMKFSALNSALFKAQ